MDRMIERIETVTARNGVRLTLQELPGRGWRCCRMDHAPHTYVPSHRTLRAALLDTFKVEL